MKQDANKMTFPTWNEITDLLKNEVSDSDRQQIMERIRSASPQDESGAGLKKWMELNDYNLEKASIWIQKIEGDYSSIREKKSGQSVLRYITASLLLVIGTIYTYFRLTKADDWEAHYIHDPGLNIPENSLSIHANWMSAYRSGQTTNAHAMLVRLKKSFPSNDTLNFYSAVMEFELGHASNALNVLSLEYISKNSIFRNRADFLEALCLWRLKRMSESKNAFMHIAKDTNTFFFKKAKQILSEDFSR